MANRFLVDVSSLNEVGATLRLEKEKEFSPIEFGEEEIEFSRPLRFNLDLNNEGLGVLAKGTVEGNLILECHRCLDKFVYPFKVEIEELFYRDRSCSEDESLEEETRVIKDKIDLAKTAEAEIILGLPTKILCREDCRGLCPLCQANLNKQECNCLKGEEIGGTKEKNV